MMHSIRRTLAWIAAAISCYSVSFADDKGPVRVFIFAGQSNMVGSDSKLDDIKRFPPFAGLEQAQPAVQFYSTIGREN